MNTPWEYTILFLFVLGALFFASAIYAFAWAKKAKQFENLEQGARSIFNEEEPEGEVTDSFPK
ncbi:MAG: cbb3-type cytochrome oxidase assembly protein CcoS [Puniceicoccales bacterium]|jgi:cbb3-type cytochrome oxidase maturation protein|nr:cbb3-type cytochrome oxidase assembly protein CcoS [Puniceicoccales bacterium]